MTTTEAPKPQLGLYEGLAIAGAVAYLALPLAVAVPGIWSTLAQVPPLEGDRLANFRALMLTVAPIGIIYLFAAHQRAASLADFSVLWRLLWVAPWMGVNVAVGALEPGGAAVIAGLDVGLPVLLLATSAKARGLVPRLVEHFKRKPTTWAQKIMNWESRIGLVAVLAASVFLVTRPDHGYVQSFVVSVLGCYMLALQWAAHAEGEKAAWFAIATRVLALGAILLSRTMGFGSEVLMNLGAFITLATLLHAYMFLWERQVMGPAAWSRTRWVATCAMVSMASSAVWVAFSPWYSATCVQLSINVHRQDLIIGTFVILVGVLLMDVGEKTAKHATIIAWLLPISMLWFTAETKLLCNLDVGSPFHPSWNARGLAPVYSGRIWIDLTFSLATTFMTAISTTYTAVVMLKFLPREGWLRMTWHGVFIILVSALWMIAASSGIPAPIEPLAATGSLPPPIRVDPIPAVSVHIRDLLLGMALIGTGWILNRLATDWARWSRYVVVVAWWLSMYPKAYLHILKMGMAG